jgi:hypothetical protein
MVYLSSTDAMTSALSRARRVSLVAYQLPYGDVFDALESAARNGASVDVRLEGRPFPDRKGGIAQHNKNVVSELRRCGAEARLVDAEGQAPLHAKAARIDGVLFLDDVNFARGGTVLRASRHPTHIAWSKPAAQRLEAGLIATRRSGIVEVETESVGSGNAVYAKLLRLGLAHRRPRLLVSRDALTAKERTCLTRLGAAGVEVRACGAREKFALAGARAWVGSANATSPYPRCRTIDWGVVTRSRIIASDLRAEFEDRWRLARAVRPEG